MKTAEELYEISKNKAPEIVAEILSGVKEKIILRCEEEAHKGGNLLYDSPRTRIILC